MSEEYGADFVTITDDEGNEYELEHLDTAEYSGGLYMAFLPADMDEDDENFGMLIFKVVEVDGEEQLETIEDDALLDAVYEIFVQRQLDE